MRTTNEDEVQHEPILLDLSFESSNDDNDEANDIEIGIAPTTSKTTDECDSVNVIISEVKTRNKFVWRIDCEWDSLDEALNFLEKQGFTCYDFSDLKCGLKFYYRCKQIPRSRKIWCAQRYTLFLPSDNGKVQILVNQHEHNHEQLLEGCVRPLSDEMKEIITDLFKTGTTKIADVLRHIDYARTKRNLFKSEKDPEKRQIEYLLRKFRDAEAPKMINVGDMINWLENHAQFPSDVNEAFVIGSQTSSFDKE